MIVWKRSKYLITGKESWYPKFIDTPIIRIFNDFDWWKSFVSKYSWWIYKNRTSLPEKIQNNLPPTHSFHMYEYDERYRGHIHW